MPLLPIQVRQDKDRISLICNGSEEYQRIRISFDCPFCDGLKSMGVLACDACKGAWGIGNGRNGYIKVLDRTEKRLLKR